MFQQIGKFSVIARLRGLTLMSVLAMLGVALGLIWTGYQQRLADRQAALKQAVDMAHARIQLAYAQQQFGRLDIVHAQQQALAALDKLGAHAADDLWINDAKRHTIRPTGRSALDTGAHAARVMAPYVKGFEPWGWVIGTGLYIDDLQSALLTQTTLALSTVLLVAMILWGLLEATAKDLKRASAESPVRPCAPARGPLAQVQGVPHKAMHDETDPTDASGDPMESAIQEVKRLRMAGAI